ncbi:MAG: hypothetical protein ACOC44_16855 [Promethearchaeia archaeon]
MILQSIQGYLMYKYQFMWLFVIVLLFIIAILFLRNGRYATTDKNKKLNIAYFAFILSYGFTRIFFFISDYYGEYQNLDDAFIFILTVKLAYISASLGLLVTLFIFEREFIPSKYIFSMINVICAILFIVLPYDMMRIVMYVFQIFVFIEILSVYIYLAAKGFGELKRRAIFTILALVLFFFGVVLDTRMISDLDIIPGFFPPILVMIGIMVFYKLQSFTTSD